MYKLHRWAENDYYHKRNINLPSYQVLEKAAMSDQISSIESWCGICAIWLKIIVLKFSFATIWFPNQASGLCWENALFCLRDYESWRIMTNHKYMMASRRPYAILSASLGDNGRRMHTTCTKYHIIHDLQSQWITQLIYACVAFLAGIWFCIFISLKKTI